LNQIKISNIRNIEILFSINPSITESIKYIIRNCLKEYIDRYGIKRIYIRFTDSLNELENSTGKPEIKDTMIAGGSNGGGPNRNPKPAPGSDPHPFGADEVIVTEYVDGPVVAAYTRTSTLKQARDGTSMESQDIIILNDMIEKIKPSLVLVFKDPGRTGTTLKRRKILDILRAAKRKVISELWILDVSRYGRIDLDNNLTYYIFAHYGVKLRSPKQDYDTKDIANRLIFLLESDKSEKENWERADKAMNGKAMRLINGIYNKGRKGSSPFAYLPDGDWIIKDEKYTAVIVYIYERYIETKSYARVLNEVNARFLDIMGKKLKRHTLEHVLSDPLYMGKPVYNKCDSALKERFKHYPELAFVDAETFMKAQEVAAENDKTYERDEEGPLEEFILDQGIDDPYLRDIAELRHKGCGGKLSDATKWTDKEGITHQYVKCDKCGEGFSFPPSKRTIKRILDQYVWGPLRAKIQSLKEPKPEKPKKDKPDEKGCDRKLTDFFSKG
jgi:DNA invertase Pin-like site-specific DNA recombinase